MQSIFLSASRGSFDTLTGSFRYAAVLKTSLSIKSGKRGLVLLVCVLRLKIKLSRLDTVDSLVQINVGLSEPKFDNSLERSIFVLARYRSAQSSTP